MKLSPVSMGLMALSLASLAAANFDCTSGKFEIAPTPGLAPTSGWSATSLSVSATSCTPIEGLKVKKLELSLQGSSEGECSPEVKIGDGFVDGALAIYYGEEVGEMASVGGPFTACSSDGIKFDGEAQGHFGVGKFTFEGKIDKTPAQDSTVENQNVQNALYQGTIQSLSFKQDF